MKKIGIVTIVGPLGNYGNQLQNYALQQTLSKLGLYSETIQDIRFCKNPLSIFTYYKAIIHSFTRYKYKPLNHKKPLNFFFWHKKYIKNAPILIKSIEDEKKLLNYFDGFVVGSDQIWGPLCPWDSSELAFLDFAPQELRVAYSPSFGSSEIPDKRKDEYKSYLSGFKALSVREYKGAEIIKNLIGIEVPVLIDPTMLLTTDEYDKIATSGPQRKYIFLYMLGDLIEQYRDYINIISKENDWEIIDIMKNPQFAGSNPSDFIGLIRDSQMVITDSFHGTVFSLLYHKPLILFNRKGTFDMYSRLETLWKKFEIQSVENNDISQININWDKFEQILQKERQVSINFLKDNLL